MNHGKTTSVVDYQPQTEDFLTNIVDPSAAKATVLAESVLPLFHEAGVWIPATREWVVTSNRIKRDDNDDDENEQYVIVSSIDINGRVRHLQHDELVMGNGGTSDGAGGVFLCSQGMGRTGGSIWHLDSTLGSCRIVVTGAPRTFMRSDPIDHQHHDDELHFNSPNDVVLYKGQWLLFTDPTYGMEQAFRTTCHLDDLVWVASLGGDNEQIVRPLISEGLVKPNGICLSPEGTVLYVTDTGYVSGMGDVSDKRPRHVLAYDIRLDNNEEGSTPIVSNRRVLFQFYCGGVPDGIKVDVDGNIYVGADDGVRVYKSDGTFLGLLAVLGGVANLCFGGDDWKDLLVLNETRAIKVRMKTPGVRLC